MIIRSIDAIIRMLDADYIENGAIEENPCIPRISWNLRSGVPSRN